LNQPAGSCVPSPMRIACLLVVLVVRAAMAAPDAPPQVGKLPAHYAKLFVEGQVFVYDAKVTTWDYAWLENNSEKKPWKKATEKLPVTTCKVVKVTTFAASIASQVTCDGHPFGEGKQWKFPVAAIYVATARGLFLPNAEDVSTTEPSLDDATLLIAAKPKATQKTVMEGVKGQGPYYSVTTGVRREGRAWCTFSRTRGAPHDGVQSLCFGGGITSGRNDVGGELHDASFRAR
jgi:hypothetical protein